MTNKLLKLTSVLLLTINASNIYADDCDSCFPQRCDYGNFSVGGDWLYWKSEESKLEYGSAVTLNSVNDDLSIRPKILRPDFEYHSGFRVFADYTTSDTLWNFSLIYTNMPTTATNHFDGSSTIATDFVSIFDVNFPILTALSEVLFESTDCKWDSTVNYFDVDVSRSFLICEWLQIIPHIGIRGLWVDQTFKLSGTSTDLSFDSKLTNKMSGVGLEAGLNASWKLCNGLSLIGNAGGAIVYADFNNNAKLIAINNTNNTTNIQYKDRNNAGIPMFDAFVGLEYKTCFSNYDFSMHIGWEEHIIFGTNEFSLSDSGSYTLQGLTLGGAVSF